MGEIFFHTEANAEVGFGHLSRCYTFARALWESTPNIQITFILSADSVENLLAPKPFFVQHLVSQDGGSEEAEEIFQLIKKRKGSVLITDSYRLSRDYYAHIRKQSRIPILAFDDDGEKVSYPVTGYINGSIAATKTIYPRPSRPYSKIGPAFFPLRHDFIKSTSEIKNSPDFSSAADEVTATFGGSDPEEQTLRVGRLLLALDSLKKIQLIAGPLCKSIGKLQRLADENPRIQLLLYPDDLPILLKKSQIVITAGGLTAQEILYLGRPLVILATHTNQRGTAEEIQKKNCGIFLGMYDQIEDAEIIEKMKELIADSANLRQMSENGPKLIDGLGSQRLAEFIHEEFNISFAPHGR